MNYQDEEEGGVTVIRVAGQINGSNAGELESGLLGYVDRGAKLVVLDLDEVDYISSAGLRVVLQLAKRLEDVEQGERFVLAGLQKSVRDVFEMCGFSDILTIVPTRAEALTRIRLADGAVSARDE